MNAHTILGEKHAKLLKKYQGKTMTDVVDITMSSLLGWLVRAVRKDVLLDKDQILVLDSLVVSHTNSLSKKTGGEYLDALVPDAASIALWVNSFVRVEK